MPIVSLNRAILRFSLLALLMAGVVLVSVSIVDQPVLEPQIDDQGTVTLVSGDGGSDPSSPEASAVPETVQRLSGSEHRHGFSDHLHFIHPPQRLVSFPGLPQAPPRLV